MKKTLLTTVSIFMLFGCDKSVSYASYEDCVLDRFKSNMADAAVGAIKSACRIKYPLQPSISKPSVKHSSSLSAELTDGDLDCFARSEELLRQSEAATKEAAELDIDEDTMALADAVARSAELAAKAAAVTAKCVDKEMPSTRQIAAPSDGPEARVRETSGDPVVGKMIAASNAQNAQLPRMLDRETRADSTGIGPGRKVTFVYTLVNHGPGSMSEEQLVTRLGTSVRNGVCTSRDMQVFIKNSADVRYLYRDNEGGVIGEIIVRPSECRQSAQTKQGRATWYTQVSQELTGLLLIERWIPASRE